MAFNQSNEMKGPRKQTPLGFLTKARELHWETVAQVGRGVGTLKVL